MIKCIHVFHISFSFNTPSPSPPHQVLEPYKYAGYPMLIKTIRMETHDDALFSKSVPLLIAATDLAYHTVKCSALNAEELHREEGIEVSLRSGLIIIKWD